LAREKKYDEGSSSAACLSIGQNGENDKETVRGGQRDPGEVRGSPCLAGIGRKPWKKSKLLEGRKRGEADDKILLGLRVVPGLTTRGRGRRGRIQRGASGEQERKNGPRKPLGEIIKWSRKWSQSDGGQVAGQNNRPWGPRGNRGEGRETLIKKQRQGDYRKACLGGHIAAREDRGGNGIRTRKLKENCRAYVAPWEIRESKGQKHSVQGRGK